MAIRKLLIANRGEIAIRVARAAQEMNLSTVAIHSQDDAASLHLQRCDVVQELPGIGAAAYLDIEAVVSAALTSECDAIHPGYGFLAESAAFARRCGDAGLTFVGPTVETLELFGDKVRARDLADRVGVPLIAGSSQPVDLAGAQEFFEALPEGQAMLIKAVAGGGGRGMRIVRSSVEIEESYARCRSEAGAAFGVDTVFVERLLPHARHIEIQVLGDGRGSLAHLGERECSLQRRHQKVVEWAPSPALDTAAREAIAQAALRLASEVDYRSLGTFEFLVAANDSSDFAIIEANPRLQVEHTVTEEVRSVDLVRAQLRIAGGESLAEVGLTQPEVPPARGFAIQARVNMERMLADGEVRPSGGVLHRFDPPSGPGVRVDSYGYAGYATNPNFDSLLAKVIAHAPSADFEETIARARRALNEFGIDGVDTNLGFLQTALAHPDFASGEISTAWVDAHWDELVEEESGDATVPATPDSGFAGAQLDTRDPLAGLNYFREGGGTRSAAFTQAGGNAGGNATPGTQPAPTIVGPPNTEPVLSPLQGTIVEVLVAAGDPVREGQHMFVMDSMKMEHQIRSDIGGILRQLTVSSGDIVYEGHPLAFIEAADVGAPVEQSEEQIDIDYVRPDLQRLFDARAMGADANREELVARRHAKGKRTQRESLADLVDPGSWVELGELVLPARHRIMSDDEMRHRAPGDGMITGIGSVNGELFPDDRATALVAMYDETVWAGTQGMMGHQKTDRIIKFADEQATPLIVWAEGAGGRSGDTDFGDVSAGGQWTPTYDMMARLSGTVPMIGITAGRTFAGNASILGLTDCIIATRDANIGMGGPATIEGGGLGLFTPEEIGPMSDIGPAGSVDILVDDEAEAIVAAKKYLSYFQGAITEWECADQRQLRHVIPENRKRPFSVRKVIELLADTESVLELRAEFGVGIITALVRIEGHPVGIIANNNEHLGGAVDGPGADKLCRFAQLCDGFNIPIFVLVDTTGMMVGPDVERLGLARKCNNVFVTLANARSPRFTLIMRKSYGLAAQAMMTGSSRAPLFALAWPTAEIGGMNLEAAVRLSHRAERAAIEDIEARAERYESLLAEMYRRGSAINSSSVHENDGVIDPVETRRYIVRGLSACENPDPIRRGRRPNIDTW